MAMRSRAPRPSRDRLGNTIEMHMVTSEFSSCYIPVLYARDAASLIGIFLPPRSHAGGELTLLRKSIANTKVDAALVHELARNFLALDPASLLVVT